MYFSEYSHLQDGYSHLSNKRGDSLIDFEKKNPSYSFIDFSEKWFGTFC